MPTASTDSLPVRRHAPREDAEVEARVGIRLGRYELVLPLASGGMAKVWIAQQVGELGFRRLVAVKTMRPEHAASASFRRMFLDEARIAARIRHANVVEVLDLGEEGPIVYQAMTLIEGDALEGLLRLHHRRQHSCGGLPPGIVVRILGDAIRGLHAAHELTDESGISVHLVHRDVSPHNILVGMDGVTKLADFGIAKALGRLSDETEVGQMKGKFSYMAPEQIDRHPPERRSDIFAAGIVLWEALTGVRLFRGIDIVDTLMRVKSGPIPDPRSLAASVPEPIAEIALRALSRDPADRFATAEQMSDALEAAARASSLPATTKDVAAFVSDLVGCEVERRREAVREASRGGTPSVQPRVVFPETQHALTIPDAPKEHRTRYGTWLLAGIVATAAIIVGSLAMTRHPKTAASPAPIPPANPYSTPDPLPAPIPAIPATAATSSPSAGDLTHGTSRARPKPRTTPLPRTTPSASGPKFANPYGS